MSLFNYTRDEDGVQVTNNAKVITHVILGTIFTIVGLVLVFGSWTIVKTGERGVVLRMEKIVRTLEPGFHGKVPFIERVVDMDVRTQKIEVEASAASNDMQIVTTNIALQFNLIPEEVDALYTNLKKSYRSKVIDPAIQDAIKATTAKFNAEELITKRPEVKEAMEITLKERLLQANILVTNLDIVDFDFSPSFNAAIEAKVTAEQNALKAQNDLERVKFEAQQSIEKAKAEATRTRLEVEALKLGSDLIEKIRAEADLKRAEAMLTAAEKWGGVLPTHMVPGGALPLIDLNTY